MRTDSRWKLTDAQRFAVTVAVVIALFLSAMSWGMNSLPLLVVAIVLFVALGLGVFMLGLRYTGKAPVRANAHVIMSSPPPVGKIVGRCDMQLLVDIEGSLATMVKFRDPSVPVIKWPRQGTVLPVEVGRRNARQLRIRWEAVQPHHARASTPAEEAAAFAVPFFTDYADGGPPQDHLDERLGQPEPATAPPPATATTLDEHFPPAPGPEADPETVRILRGLVLDGELVVGTDNMVEGEVVAASDTDPVGQADPARHTEQVGKDVKSTGSPDPANADPASAASSVSAVEDETYELPMRTIPQPRTAHSTEQAEPQGMGIMLIVSDLPRSLRFYQDVLDFALVDNNSGSAVLSYGGGRILLRRVVDMSPVDRRVVHLHIQVPDVEAAYEDLKAKGVEFVHRPRVMNRGDKLELWAATFRDPDGHAIALTQWRDRT